VTEAAGQLPRRPRAVVFDMDGVLIDSEPLWHEAEIAAFGRRGLRLTSADCQQTTGVRIDAVVRFWVERSPALDGVDEAALVDDIISGVVDRIATRGEPVPGSLATLHEVARAGLPLGLASSSPPEVIAAALTRLEVGQLFGAVCSAWALPRPKPDPTVYLQACAALGVAPADAVAIEDSQSGLLAGIGAGMMVIAFVSEGLPMPPAAASADVVVSNLGQVPAALSAR
jgi:HAD superfamily hydrolase (TIGR01509 family)